MKIAENPDVLRALHRTMVRIRICEEALVEPILSREIRCPVHLYSGQEAIAAGVCASLNTGDRVFGTHRSHGHYLAKGGDLAKMVAEIFCRESGCAAGRGGSMHVVDVEAGMSGAAPIVAGTISLAVGAGLASAVRDDGQVAVCFFGDGATGEGVLYESMNFAALRKLPVIFVCENNFYSTHLPISEIRVSDEIWKVAEPFGIPTVRVDGNDVLEVYRAAGRMIDAARNGQGPAFIECVTYRLRGHVGPDDNIQGSHTDIRPEAEIAQWRAKDPIPRFEAILIREGIADRAFLDSVHADAMQEVNRAVAAARSAAFPKPEGVAHHVFA